MESSKIWKELDEKEGFIRSKTENNFLAAVINKEESDSEISRKLQIFNEEGITFKKVKTKRNSDNEIISIQISGSGNGSVYNFNQTSDEPIDEIYLIKEYGKSSKLTISEKKDLKTAFAKNKTVTVEEVEIDEEVLLNDHFPTPPPTPPTPTALIKETSYKAIETNQEKNRLYIINGKEYFQNELKGYTLKCDGAITYYEEDEAIKKFGEKAKDGVMVFNGVTTLEKINVSKEMQERKTIIFSNDNGDDIVFIPAEKSLKVPHYPSIKLNDDGLVLMVNGVQKSNPLETLNQMNLQNVKSVRVYDENGKETPGSQTKKIVITTK